MKKVTVISIALVLTYFVALFVSLRIVQAQFRSQYVTVVLKKEDAKQIADYCSCCAAEVRGAFKTALGLPSVPTREEDEQALKDIKSGKADYGDPRQPLKSKPDGPDERPDEP